MCPEPAPRVREVIYYLCISTVTGFCLPHLSNLCSMVNLGGSQMLHIGNVSVAALEREDLLCHLPHLFTYQLCVWDGREFRLGEAVD